MMGWRVRDIAPSPEIPDEYVATLRRLTWFGLGPEVELRAFGSGTVWRDSETGRRLGLELEIFLADMLALWRHRGMLP